MRRSSLASVTAGSLLLLFLLSACSLVTSLDGFAGGAVDAPPEAGLEGGTDASGADSADAVAAMDAADAIVDAGATDDAGPNIHPQGTFETGTTDPWTFYQATGSLSTTPHTGGFSCRVCIQPGITDFFTGDDGGALGPPIQGATYRARAWVRLDPSSPSPGPSGIFLRHFDLTNGFTDLESTASPTLALTSTWQRFETTLTIKKPGGTLNAFIGADAVANACFLFDDVVVQRVQ